MSREYIFHLIRIHYAVEFILVVFLPLFKFITNFSPFYNHVSRRLLKMQFSAIKMFQFQFTNVKLCVVESDHLSRVVKNVSS
jgi:hypothetical protein